jgi:hypothetical protein
VDELLRREGYARRLLDEASTLRDELSVAMDERGRCEGDMAARRAAVRAAEAALRVVESHKERWVRERARQRELRDEDDLAVGQRASEPGGELASSRKAAREGRRC